MRLPTSYESITKFSDYQLYIAYLALKNHFTKDSYDFHKYQGKVGASQQSFETRKDRYSFQKLARHRDPFGLLFSNILHNPEVWIGSITSDNSAEQIYSVWKKRQESLSYSFKEELKFLGNIDDVLYVEKNGQPELLKFLMNNQVSLETVCMLQTGINFIPYWEREMDIIVWSNWKRRITKYIMFLDVEREKINKMIASHNDNLLDIG